MQVRIDDPTHLAYDEEGFFAALDAGQLEGQYSQVQISNERGVRYAYAVAPFGFTLIDEVIAAVQHRVVGHVAPARNIGLVQWQPGSVARLVANRAARGVTGNPHRAAREKSRAGGW